MATYNSYQDFLNAAGLAQLAGPAAEEAFKEEPIEFVVSQAAIPNTNTPYRASSTVIRNVKKPNPDSTTTFVTIGNSGYVYPMTDSQMATWMKSNTLGGFYNRYIKRK